MQEVVKLGLHGGVEERQEERGRVGTRRLRERGGKGWIDETDTGARSLSEDRLRWARRASSAVSDPRA